ncbi:MAG: hypothetical protein Q9203_005795 [Teloschistes exilis]
MTEGTQLSSRQAHALFDILTSRATLTEIENLKYIKIIATFGPPLQPQPSSNEKPSSPLLRILLRSFILDLPGFRNVTSQFWTDSVVPLAKALNNSNLSESYDKASVGIRRTLSTAIASIVESVSRGRLGGYPKKSLKQDSLYDQANPEHVVRAWDDFLQCIIYDDLLDKMFIKAAETDRLSDHESVVQAAHQYALIMLASLLHHNLIVSPRGQSIISLLNRVHRLAPYFLIKQTLKVGNAASMLSGMTQLVLAKMNLSTLTSWFGGQVSDSGMNLLQQIISQVLSAENTELRKRVKQIEQSKDAPKKSQLDLLREYSFKPADEQQSIRKESAMMTEPTHKHALDYLSLHLSIRDREQLIQVLCHSSPDLLTTCIRELVSVYDPIIRALHKAVDLGSGVTDAQSFLDDLIALAHIDSSSKSTKPAPVPTIKDFVHLLQKHAKSSHVFIHQALKNGKELSEWYHEYAIHAISQYKQQQQQQQQQQQDPQTNPEPESGEEDTKTASAAGDFTPFLTSLLSSIQNSNDHQKCLTQIDAHASFLDSLAQKSKKSMDATVRASLATTQSSSSPPNTASSNNAAEERERGSPGIFLLKWQHFIDATPITPGPNDGKPRTGKSKSVKVMSAVDVEGSVGAAAAAGELGGDGDGDGDLEPPDVRRVLEVLGPGFREELGRLVDSRDRIIVFHPDQNPLPLVGNLLDLPPKGLPEFKHWLKHKDIHGPISSITVMGLTLIIFHDKDAAQAIMGKNAQKTSARPQLNFAQLSTKGLSAGLQPIQEKEALKFVLQTFNDPDNMMVHLKTLAAATIVKICYGYEIERKGSDPLVDLIEHALDNLELAFVPLSWAIDAVPALKYLPDWFPGTSYRKTAREWKATNEAAAELPYSFVKRQVALDAHRPSYVSNLLQRSMVMIGNDVEFDPADEEAIRWTVASLYVAGADSTVAVIQSVICALLVFPEVVQKAQ